LKQKPEAGALGFFVAETPGGQNFGLSLSWILASALLIERLMRSQRAMSER
jgi:hypothetical protein